MPTTQSPHEFLALLDPLMRQLGGAIISEQADSVDGAAGTIAGLPVWVGAGNAHEATQHARHRARRGHLGVVIMCDDRHAQWHLAVTLSPIRVATIDLTDADPLVARRVRRAVHTARATPLETCVALAEAVDVDAAGRRTFRALHALLQRGMACIPRTVNRDDAHAWVLTQLTRLLFLRFVEAEGWLDGNPAFLATAFDRCLSRRRDVTRDLLHPLFFGTLNRTYAERSRLSRSFGAVPFLNGGLFEPHAVERSHKLALPVAFWQEAFSALVEHLEVGLDANVDDGRVTPELMGRVFEGVMHPDERKATGAFFTPPALVDAILRGALASHLAPRLACSEAAVERALHDPDPRLRRALLDVTVLDPAAGSGAFLVGALALLHGPGPREPMRVRHLVTRRLFAVDSHPGAVRVCELRLWLEVLRAQRGRAPRDVAPLPNLDTSVRAGDALIDPLFDTSLTGAWAQEIRRQQRTLASAHGPAKRGAASLIRRTERTAMVHALEAREQLLDHEIDDLLAAARSPDLFGRRAPLAASTRSALAERRVARTHLRNERRRMLRDAQAAPFAIHAAFAPVMATRGGFDLVVGNPPWVRAEQLAPALRKALSERYRWWQGQGSGGWKHLPDLSVAFVERGYSLLAPGGTLAFLVPAKLATAGYAHACRTGLAARAAIHCVADLGDDPRAGFEATTYPLAIIASRRAAAPGHMVRLGLSNKAPSQPQSLWHDMPHWMTAAPAVQRLAARLTRAYTTVKDHVRPQLGVKTGANDAFFDPPPALYPWTRLAIRGRDIRPFTTLAGIRMLWPADDRGAPWPVLPPPVEEYLAIHMQRLQQRADQTRGPWWQLYRTGPATAAHRVIWRDLAPELQAAVPPGPDVVPVNSCYVAAMPCATAASAMTAWFNSTPVRALARLAAEPAAGGCARFGARSVGGIPLPAGVLTNSELAAFATRSHGEATMQTELDHLVANLLELEDDERELLSDVASHRR